MALVLTDLHARDGEPPRRRRPIMTRGMGTQRARDHRSSRPGSGPVTPAPTDPHAKARRSSRPGRPPIAPAKCRDARRQFCRGVRGSPIITPRKRAHHAVEARSPRPGGRSIAPAKSDHRARHGDPSRPRIPVMAPAIRTEQSNHDRSSRQGRGLIAPTRTDLHSMQGCSSRVWRSAIMPSRGGHHDDPTAIARPLSSSVETTNITHARMDGRAARQAGSGRIASVTGMDTLGPRT